MTLLRILLKILLTPIVLLLSLLLLILKGMLYIAGGLGILLAIVFALFGIYCLFDEVYRWSAVPALISAFLFSPIGIPLVGVFVIANLELFRDWLKNI